MKQCTRGEILGFQEINKLQFRIANLNCSSPRFIDVAALVHFKIITLLLVSSVFSSPFVFQFFVNNLMLQSGFISRICSFV